LAGEGRERGIFRSIIQAQVPTRDTIITTVEVFAHDHS
jgi:hypothetical protein